MTEKRVLIVGGGPAGCSAALWARTRGLEATILEREPQSGGQLHAIHVHPPQLPGIDVGDGAALAAVSARQLEHAGVEMLLNTHARSIERNEGRPAVQASHGGGSGSLVRHPADAVLIACGLARRRLEIPGEREFEGRGVSFSATRDRASLAGGSVMVVGGGDAAFENVWLLAEAGSRVTLVMRGEPRARRSFRERVAAASGVSVFTHTRVDALLGDQRLRRARLTTAEGTREIELTGAVIKIGRVPETKWCSPPLLTDAAGFIRADANGRTSEAGFWAAGDVTHPPLLAIPLAHASAATAIFDIARALLDE
jgi:thioredoxin reductase (NADPH)